MTTLMLSLCLSVAMTGQSDPAQLKRSTRLTITKMDGTTVEAVLVNLSPSVGFEGAGEHGAVRVNVDDLFRVSPVVMPPAPQTTGACTIYLASGGTLRGDLLPDAPPRALRIASCLDRPLDFPFKALRGLRLGLNHAAAAREFEARLGSPPSDKDLLLVIKDDKVVTLAGAVEKITPEQIDFLAGRSSHVAPRSAVYGVVLGAPPTKGDLVPSHCTLTTGDTLCGTLGPSDHKRLVLSIPGAGDISIPWSLVASLDFRGRRAVWLSDLKPDRHEAKSILSPYFPPQLDRGPTGLPLALRSKKFARGIGLHANTAIAYRLDGAYDRFLAVIGVDDSARGAGSVVFRVRADDRVLYESKILRGSDQPEPINLDLHGARVLTLECDDAGDLDVADHGVWADATLLRSTDGTQ